MFERFMNLMKRIIGKYSNSVNQTYELGFHEKYNIIFLNEFDQKFESGQISCDDNVAMLHPGEWSINMDGHLVDMFLLEYNHSTPYYCVENIEVTK